MIGAALVHVVGGFLIALSTTAHIVNHFAPEKFAPPEHRYWMWGLCLMAGFWLGIAT